MVAVKTAKPAGRAFRVVLRRKRLALLQISFGPFGTKRDADAAATLLQRAHPKHLVLVEPDV